MTERYETFTVLINRIARNIRKIKRGFSIFVDGLMT